MMPIDSVKWNTFDSDRDAIDLKEVQVTAASPYVRETIGGLTYLVNIYTGRRKLIGEAGLQNVYPEFDLLMFTRFFVNQGAKTGINQAGRIAASRTAVRKLPRSAINRGIRFAMERNKRQHIFGNVAHNLGSLVPQLGSERNVIAATLNALNNGGYLATSGIVQKVTVNVAGSNVTVRFVVHDGFPKIGTMFIP